MSVQGPRRLQLIFAVASLICIPFSSPWPVPYNPIYSNLTNMFTLCFLQIARAVSGDCCVFSRLLQEHVSFFTSWAWHERGSWRNAGGSVNGTVLPLLLSPLLFSLLLCLNFSIVSFSICTSFGFPSHLLKSSLSLSPFLFSCIFSIPFLHLFYTSLFSPLFLVSFSLVVSSPLLFSPLLSGED